MKLQNHLIVGIPLFLSVALVQRKDYVNAAFLSSGRGPVHTTTSARYLFGVAPGPLRSTESDTTDNAVAASTNAEDTTAMSIRAPLRYVGPYPCLSLRFPTLATKSQRERNVTGVSLDFILDTAANTNTINAQVASELGLEAVGEALPGVGAGGAIGGGTTFLFGRCELDGVPTEEGLDPTFMDGLTASALPVASPAAAGLLGVYFFDSFLGGVAFDWGSVLPSKGEVTSPTLPSVTFFGDRIGMEGVVGGMERIKVKRLEGSNLPSITLNINGVDVPALLDTGSPVTVLNAGAARVAGIDKKALSTTGDNKKSSFNPFARMSENFKVAQAAAKGDVLMIAGSNGERVDLVKSSQLVSARVGSADFGMCHVYVGDLPGLDALGGLGGGAPPAAVLGMDVLRRRQRMVYRAEEVFF